MVTETKEQFEERYEQVLKRFWSSLIAFNKAQAVLLFEGENSANGFIDIKYHTDLIKLEEEHLIARLNFKEAYVDGLKKGYFKKDE